MFDGSIILEITLFVLIFGGLLVLLILLKVFLLRPREMKKLALNLINLKGK